MTVRVFMAFAALAFAPAAQAAEFEVTGIQAVHRHGQTFVTWKDIAEGEDGAKFRYSLYRSGEPVTAANLEKAELCYHGVLNCSAKLFGHVFNMKDRLDPAKPYAIIEEGGKPLPAWSGLAVHTVQKPGKAYYAVVATDEKFKPVSAVVPGKSATTVAVDEMPGPIQPIKLYDSKERKSYVAQTSITGQKGLPLSISLHGSQATGGPAGEWGDYYLYFGTPAMGYRDGIPGVFTVQENRDKAGNMLVLRPRDAIEHPSGRGAFETMWFGYYCIPHGATHSEPRVYPFTENRLLWMIDWSLRHYGGDPLRVSLGGNSMGGLGSINVGFRHPELFAAVYPSIAPFLWRAPSSFHGAVTRDSKALMADGKTTYADYTNSITFAAAHHEDMPFLGWAVGRQDSNHTWKEYIDMVKALTDNHHGFAFSWNDGGHSEGGRAMTPISKDYPASRFARDRSYPAFGNSSIDSAMGNGSKDDGDREGGVNLGFDWKDLVDEKGKWSVAVTNHLAKNAMTVDVTPRRCQNFKATPGAKYAWSTSTGMKGTAVADKWGLVTVPKMVINPGMGTVLTIQADR